MRVATLLLVGVALSTVNSYDEVVEEIQRQGAE